MQEAYRALIRLRHETRALVYGAFRVRDRRKGRFAYERELDGERYLVDCNLGPRPRRAFPLEGRWELVYASAARNGDEKELRGYEARIWKKTAENGGAQA